MKRREAMKRAVVAAGALAVPSAVMALGDKRSSIAGLSVAQLLAIYDPTLDVTAQPVFLPESAKEGFIPLPEWLHVDRVEASGGIARCWTDGDHPIPDIPSKRFRVLLNGRMVKGANAASAEGGWVGFLAHRPDKDGKMNPYSHAWRDGHYDLKSPGGAVTGIAFGVIEWMIDPAYLERRPKPDADELDV